SADDCPAIVSTKSCLFRTQERRRSVEAVVEQRHGPTPGKRLGRTAALEWIEIVLVQRQTQRQARRKVVIDQFEGQAVVRGRLQRAEEVDRLRVEPAVADVPIAAHIAAEQRIFEIADLLARGEIVVE